MGARTPQVFRCTWRAAWSSVSVLAVACASCVADTPRLTDAGGAVDGECTPYADLLVVYTPADGSSGDGAPALGAPDSVAVPVAASDVLTVGFVGIGGIADGAEVGSDIQVHAAAADGTEVTAYLSVDGEVWESAGTVGTTAAGPVLEIDIANSATLTLASYVQLVGVAGRLEVDALQALQPACTMSVR